MRSDLIIISRISHDRYAGVVLRRTAQHRRPANVDVLNRFLQGDARLCHGLLKRIKIHHDQIDRLNAVLAHRRFVCRVPPKVEEPAVNFRMQRFHPAIEHFRKTGVRAKIGYREARLTQRLPGAAGGNQFHAGFSQLFRKRD